MRNTINILALIVALSLAACSSSRKLTSHRESSTATSVATATAIDSCARIVTERTLTEDTAKTEEMEMTKGRITIERDTMGEPIYLEWMIYKYCNTIQASAHEAQTAAKTTQTAVKATSAATESTTEDGTADTIEEKASGAPWEMRIGAALLVLVLGGAFIVFVADKLRK